MYSGSSDLKPIGKLFDIVCHDPWFKIWASKLVLLIVRQFNLKEVSVTSSCDLDPPHLGPALL